LTEDLNIYYNVSLLLQFYELVKYHKADGYKIRPVTLHG
jgi:hypothetical protein